MNLDNNIQSIKNKLEKMINNLQLEDARYYLKQFKEIVPNDKEISSYEIVIEILDGNLENAERLAIKILEENPFSIDTLFNLGYIKESKGSFQEAYDLYLDCLSLSKGQNQEVTEALNRIRNNNVPLKKTQNVVFFCKNGLDSFLSDIISKLSNDYRIKKIMVSDLKQIDIGMLWADICWFEWCDELLIYGSQTDIAKDKKIVCRLHSYEAFTNYIYNVNWVTVDKLIFVADHIKNIVIKQISDIEESQIAVIPNGINLDKFQFNNRKKGFNIAYVGHINFKKGPMLLLHAFKGIYAIDSRYKLFIAGDFQEPRYKLYFNQMIHEMGLENNVFLEGWQSNIGEWLEDKHYIISTSVLEGHPVGIMESMARGLKPLVHNFVGARGIYNPEFIWNTIEECAQLVTSDEYTPVKYRKFIEQNFTLDKQIINIKDLFKELNKTNSEMDQQNKNSNGEYLMNLKENKSVKEVENFYNNFLDYLKGDRLRENPRHIYLKNRLKQLINSDDSVLELGCGIGITTEYISQLGVREVIGVDLSPKLIDYAKSSVKNVEFMVHDITTLNLNKKFDLITLCDVMEHVPREKYNQLFCVIKEHLNENGKVFISIPDPAYLDFIRSIFPEKLQIIDNSITMDEIVNLSNKANLKIKYFNVYSIFIEHEYNEYLLINNESYGETWESLKNIK